MEIREKKHIDFKYNFKCYWEIVRKYKFVMLLIILFILVGTIIDLAGNYLLKIIIDNGTEFLAERLSKIDFIHSLISVALIYCAMEIGLIISMWFRMSLINKLETDSIFDLKKKYFSHLMGLSHNFYTTNKTGSLISRLGRGSSALERMTDVFVFTLFPTLFKICVAASAILYFDKTISLILLGTVLVFVGYSFILQRFQEPLNLKANKNEDIEKGNVADTFTNIDSIKYFGKEDYIRKKYESLADNTRESFLKNWNYFRIVGLGQMLILGIGTFLLIYFSINQVFAGVMSIGTLTFIYTTYGKLVGPLYELVHGMRGFYRSMADFQDLFAYGKIESEIKNKVNAKELSIKEGKISFKNVNFKYGKRKIFENFNLFINKNEKIALVGHSGSGKSTLIKLLYRLYDLNEGEILIDDKNITDVKYESLRSEMSIVPQECVLFDDTIYNNITFSNPNAKRAEVLSVIKFAQLDKIIEKFPQKENTIVGERGIKLSGGEKQRVSIARALLANKKILVLDEATSSLDSQTEKDIQNDLAKLMKDRTSIIIAHRLSTIMSADKIVVLKDGKIVQIGSHRELIKQKGEYQHLWNLQKGGYIK